MMQKTKVLILTALIAGLGACATRGELKTVSGRTLENEKFSALQIQANTVLANQGNAIAQRLIAAEETIRAQGERLAAVEALTKKKRK